MYIEYDYEYDISTMSKARKFSVFLYKSKYNHEKSHDYIFAFCELNFRLQTIKSYYSNIKRIEMFIILLQLQHKIYIKKVIIKFI